MGEKFGAIIMFIAMFIGGMAVGFGNGWKMSIVLVAGLPCIGGGTVLMIWALTTGQKKINHIN